jgi:hypothetical protein
MPTLSGNNVDGTFQRATKNEELIVEASTGPSSFMSIMIVLVIILLLLMCYRYYFIIIGLMASRYRSENNDTRRKSGRFTIYDGEELQLKISQRLGSSRTTISNDSSQAFYPPKRKTGIMFSTVKAPEGSIEFNPNPNPPAQVNQTTVTSENPLFSTSSINRRTGEFQTNMESNNPIFKNEKAPSHKRSLSFAEETTVTSENPLISTGSINRRTGEFQTNLESNPPIFKNEKAPNHKRSLSFSEEKSDMPNTHI